MNPDDPTLSQLTPEEWARLSESFVDLNSTGTPPGGVEAPQSQAWYESLVVRLADALQGAVGSVAEAATDGGHLPPAPDEMPAHVLTVDEWIRQRFGNREVDGSERVLATREHRMAVSDAIQQGLYVAPEVIASHPALKRQLDEQKAVDRQRQHSHVWEVVDEDGFDVVEDLDAPATPMELPSEIPEGRPSAAFVNVLNPDAVVPVSDEVPTQSGQVEIPESSRVVRSEPEELPMATPSELFPSQPSPQSQPAEPVTQPASRFDDEPRIAPTATASAPLSDDVLAAMFGTGGNPWATPSEPDELPMQSGHVGIPESSRVVPSQPVEQLTPTNSPTVGVSRSESEPSVTQPLVPDALPQLSTPTAPEADLSSLSIDELREMHERIVRESGDDGAWNHPEFAAHSAELQRREAAYWRGVLGTGPRRNPAAASTIPPMSREAFARAFRVPAASEVTPPNEASQAVSPSNELGPRAQAVVDELRSEFSATQERIDEVHDAVAEPVTPETVINEVRGGGSVLMTVLGNLFGLGGGNGGGGGPRPPCGGGGGGGMPPDEPPDDDGGEADWLGTLLSGTAGMTPEAAALWAGRLRGAGTRFLQGAAVGTATHGASAGTAGGIASMGLGVEVGVPLGNLAMDAVGAIANAPQWLQRADQSDVARGFVGAGASVGGAAIGMGVGAAIGGPVGAGIGAVVGEGFEKLVMWTEKLAEGLHSFAERINKSNEELGRYNGTIAATQLQLEMNRLSREFEKANETSASAATLAKAVDEMEESTKAFNEDLSKVSNTLATIAADLVGTLGKLYEFASSLSPVSLETGVTAGVVAAVGMIPVVGPALQALIAAQATLRKIEENTRPGQDATPMGKAIIRELITQAPQKVKDPINPLWEK